MRLALRLARTGVPAAALILAMIPAVFQSQTPVARVEFGGEADLGVALEQPRDMRFTRSGVVVVENSAPYVRLLSRSGRLLHAGVKAGSGPGEVRHISAVAISSSRDALLIFDPALRRVNRFRVADSVSLVNAHSVPLHVEAACLLGDNLWVAGVHGEQAVVHRLVLREGKYVVGQSLGSFQIGHPLQDNRLFRMQVVSSRVLCSETRNQIALGSRHLGVIQRINVATGAVSMLKVPGFMPLQFSLEGPSLVLQHGPEGVADEIVSLFERPDGYRVMVGRTDKTHRGDGDFLSVREVFVPFNATAPNKVRMLKELELDRDGLRVLCYSAAPFPMGAVVGNGAGCKVR